MGTAKVIKPAQLLDKDTAKSSLMIATVPLLVFIFIQFADIGLMEIFL